MLRFFERFLFLRLGSYPIIPALVGAYHMGQGRRIYVNYVHGRPARRPLPQTVAEFKKQSGI